MKRLGVVVCAVLLVFVGSQLHADEIEFGFRPVPPYVMLDANKKLVGLEYEIIASALAAAGHSVKGKTMPLARLVQTFQEGGVQAAAPILPSTNSGGTLSEVYLVYNNIAMGLKASNLKVASIADLKNLRVVAFQTATKALGPDFAAAVENNKQYKEEATQITQIKLLCNNRVDVVIGEARILNYFLRAPETEVDPATPVDEFRIFPPTNYRVAFKNPKYAEDFNKGLDIIKKNGTYDAILAKYK